MKYVVIKTGGKQYRVSEGDVIEVERLLTDKDQKVTFSDILLYSNDGTAKVGMPFVDGMSVAAVVLDHIKGEKIRVSKFKAKSRFRRVTGHRQSLTKLRIETIHDGKPKKEVKADEPVAEEKVAKPTRVAKARTA